MIIEGDELYTKVNKNVPQEDSLGWTIVFIERRTRFLWLMKCGKKDKQLFKNAMRILYDIIKQTNDLKLFTDGERRYSNMLFEICFELIYTGHRPRKTNTYAKNTDKLQQRLDLIWIKHNFVDKHFTTKKIPAVELEIVENGFTFEDLFYIRIAS